MFQSPFVVVVVSFPPADDVNLNSTVLNWPRQSNVELERSRARQAAKRELTVKHLENRLQDKHISLAWLLTAVPREPEYFSINLPLSILRDKVLAGRTYFSDSLGTIVF